MKKGYWTGQVKEIKNEEQWTKYVNKFLAIGFFLFNLIAIFFTNNKFFVFKSV